MEAHVAVPRPPKRSRLTPADGGGGRVPASQRGRLEQRKMTSACTECRKQKIRCEMLNEEPPCTRCQRRGLSCTLHTAHRPSGVEAQQFAMLGCDVRNVHAALQRVCEHLAVDPPLPLVAHKHIEATAADGANGVNAEFEQSGEDGGYDWSPAASPSNVRAPIDAFLCSAKSDSEVAGGMPRTPQKRSCLRLDLVSKCLITHDTAEKLVQRYMTHLDPFIYGLAGKEKSLDELKKASPTLLAAVCTVSALQDPARPELFEICYKEYRRLIASTMFQKRGYEYIRALCVGSFWLLDASHILVSDAVRRSADARLHAEIYTVLELAIARPVSHPDPLQEATQRVRLWYLLFISDQHLSVLHNRDRLIRHEKDILEHVDVFLTRADASNQDVRLVSQVSLLLLMGEMRDCFGSELAHPVPKTLSVQFTHFTRELETWYAKFSVLFEPDPSIGEFPLTGLQLHYQFGKLYLAHHVFRGLQTNPVPLHFLATANVGHGAAAAIFRMLLSNQVLKDNLMGVPHYFHVMIAFAGHFMLDVCTKYREQLNVIAEEDIGLISAVIAQLADLSTLPQHPISRISIGLLRRLSDAATMLGLQDLMSGSPLGHLASSYAGAGDPVMTVAGSQIPHAFHENFVLPGEFSYLDFGELPYEDLAFALTG